MTKTGILIVGLGNPILGDDGVGWRVVEALDSAFGATHLSAETVCLSVGGLGLMERLQGCKHAILVDSIRTGGFPDGSVGVLPLEALEGTAAGHSTSAHDVSLIAALDAGRQMGLDLPETITVVAIEATTVNDFSEQLTPAVAAAIPLAVQAVLDLLQAQ